MTPKVLWPHDCDVCVFLDRYGDMDLYYCPRTSGDPMRGSAIARYGREPSEYASMDIEVCEGMTTCALAGTHIRGVYLAWSLAVGMGLCRRPTNAIVSGLVSLIEATGGVTFDDDGLYAPVADPDWVDLGELYGEACMVIGKRPMVNKD